MKKILKRVLTLALTAVITFASISMESKAANPISEPPSSYLPMWYYIYNHTTYPGIHESWITSYWSSVTGHMNTSTTPGALYIAQNGMNTYCTKQTLNLEVFLMENPDLVAAGITSRDAVWNWICTYDYLSPRQIHSTNIDEEYYCIIRDWCIMLGVYNWAGNTLTIAQRTDIIDNYLCQNYQYDYTYSNYSFQEMMMTGVGVCNAYAGLFDAMASMSGINCGMVSGPDHIWNAVQGEDGFWYEVDSTWNDAGKKSNKRYYLTKVHGGGMPAWEQSWWIAEDLQ